MKILKDCPLFADIAEDDLKALLDCLSAVRAEFEKGGFMVEAGEPATRVGVITEGSAHVIQEDYWGNRTILALIRPGELFGEALAGAGLAKSPVSVVAAEKTGVLLIDLARLVTTCSSACVFHAGLIKNLLRILARKNISLIRKIEQVTRRTTREKLLAYLSAQAQAAESSTFEIAFNRQELADYLAVDRSALSAELSKMSREGLLRYDRNRFTIVKER
ncbi:MAG: Crp/Fnr family transcriptional regulator [Candidatus Adiutrix sp.]|nr:Crp/Fnr family transcriptional regulator [Candidatus Adiutrix sp.]